MRQPPRSTPVLPWPRTREHCPNEHVRTPREDEEIRQRLDDVGGFELPIDPDRYAFPGELIHDAQHAELSTGVGGILDEVVGPDMVWIFRPKPDA